MKKVRIYKENELLFESASMTSNFLERFKGLMGKKALSIDKSLCIIPCNSIHMFFMKFPIDVVFLDETGKVIHLIANLKPWNISKIIKKSKLVIEMPVGTIEMKNIRINDKIEFRYIKNE